MSRYTLTALTIILALLAPGCEKSDPVANANTTIILTADPSNIDLNGIRVEGNADITATVFDENGAPEVGIGVLFSTDFGSLKSAGQKVKTDGSGIVKDTLTTDISATVTVRSGGISESVTVEVNGKNLPPTAGFSISNNPARAGTDVVFNGAGSNDPNGSGSIEDYTWTFLSTNPDDPANNPEVVIVDSFPSLVKTFINEQMVTITLVVTDQGGLSSDPESGPALDVQANLRPTANAGPNASVALGTAYFGDATQSTDPDGCIKRYDWNFGDGTVTVNRTQPIQTHSYAFTGMFSVLLTVFDNGDGVQDPACSTSACGVLNQCNAFKTAQATTQVTVIP